jgi:hypothetical protein
VDWEPFSNKTHGSLPGEAVGGAEEDLGRPAPGEGHEAHAFLEVAVAGQEFESRQIPSRQGSKGRCSGGKEVVAFPSLARAFSCGSCHQPPVCFSFSALGAGGCQTEKG